MKVKILDTILDWIFPPHCPFCGEILDHAGICDSCQSQLPWLSGSQSKTELEFVDHCYSPLFYDERVKQGIAAYKFQGAQYHGKSFAQFMNQCIGDSLDTEYDVITWVPLHPRRRKERGFHQTKLLGTEIGRLRGIPAWELLRKERKTDAQSGLTEDAARRANVLGAFSVLDGKMVAGKRILLVDDVVTTGATLSECARILKTAGAETVDVITLAKARKN